MEEYTSEVEGIQASKTSSQKLHEKYKTLEKHYEVFTKSSIKTKPCKNSPRHFLSSNVQNPTKTPKKSPSSSCYFSPITFERSTSGELWRVRTNELAKEETRDREITLERGKLKGRRLLFEDYEEIVRVFPKVINVEKGELSSCLAKYGYENNACGEILEVKMVGVNKLGRNNKSKVLKMFIVLILMSLFVLCIYLGFDMYGTNGSGLEVILLPT